MITIWKISKMIFTITCVTLFVLSAFLAGARSGVSARADSIHIPANAEWVNTGVLVEQYHGVFLEAHGMAHTGKINLLPAAKNGPGGQDWNLGCGKYESAPGPCALDGAPYGALVGRVGESGEAFLIGEAQYFEAPATGDLFLAVNDNLAFYEDNSGGFNVIFRGGNLAGGYILARPDIDMIEGRFWPAGEEVRLRIFDAVDGVLYKETQAVAGEPWDPAGTNVIFDLAGQGFDLAPGQRILMSSGGHTRELWVAPVAMANFSIQNAVITGTCDPAIFCWAHLDDRDPYEFTVQESSFTARFNYLIPWEWGWAFQWDADGDETRIRFQVNTDDARMISANPVEEAVEGAYWKAGLPVTIHVEDENGGFVHEETLIPDRVYDRPGGSYVRFDLAAQGKDIQAGDTITMTNGTVYRELVVSPVAVTDVHFAEGTVSGISNPAIFFYTHMDDGRDAEEISVAEDGTWTARFATLAAGEWGQAFQWEPDGDETRIHFRTPAPALNAWLFWNTVDASEFEIGRTVTLTIGDFSMETMVLPSEWKPGDPTESHAHFALEDGHRLTAGDHVVVSDGVTTKELDIPALSVTGYDLQAKTVSGTYDPSMPLYVHVNGIEPTSLVFEEATWVATFPELAWDWWGDAIQQDGDRDLAIATIHTAE